MNNLLKKLALIIVGIIIVIFNFSLVLKISNFDKIILNNFFISLDQVLNNFYFEKLEKKKSIKNEITFEEINCELNENFQKEYFINAVSALIVPLKNNYEVIVSSGYNYFDFEISKNKKPIYIFISKFHTLVKKNKVAIVIDDVGYSIIHLEDFLQAEVPFTFSILPMEINTRDCVAKLKNLKSSYLLHLPMEPYGYPRKNAGKMSLLKSMNKEEIEQKIASALISVEDCIGVNNHMGSKFTEDEDKMVIVMNYLKSKKLFFLDSKTTQKSKCLSAAITTDIKYFENNVFLDNSRDYDYIKKQFEYLLYYAKNHKKTIAIGHIGSYEIVKVFLEMKQEFEKSNIEFVNIKEFLK